MTHSNDVYKGEERRHNIDRRDCHMDCAEILTLKEKSKSLWSRINFLMWIIGISAALIVGINLRTWDIVYDVKDYVTSQMVVMEMNSKDIDKIEDRIDTIDKRMWGDSHDE
jgi:hypothetical protein